MRKKTVISFIMLFLLIISCKDETKKDEIIKTKKIFLDKIKPDTKYILADSLTNTYHVENIGEYVLAVTALNNNMFYILSKKDFTVITGLCPLGEGPEEFSSPFASYNNNNNTLVLTEDDRARLTIVDIASSISQKKTIIKHQTSLSKTGKAIYRVFGSNPPYPAYVLDGMNFSLYTLSPNRQLHDTDLLLPKINLPKSLENGLFYVTQSIQAYNEKKHILFVANLYIPCFDLIETETRKVKRFYLDSRIKEAEAISSKYTLYVWGLIGTDKYVYVGFCNAEKGQDPEQKLIYVFDWEGNPVKRYELPFSGRSFTVNSENTKLYALTTNENHAEIHSFNIKL